MVHEMLKNNNPLIWPTILWQIRGLLKHSAIRYKATVAHERLLMTQMGLRCYVSDHGTVPARLDDLVPVYVRRIPQDPFADQPLVYKVQGANWMIYSVGPDGVDDGGK